MKDKDTRPEGESYFKNSSRRSFEDDPSLKELSFSLQQKSCLLRNNEFVETIIKDEEEKIKSFPKIIPSNNRTSFFADNINNLPELKTDFKESLSKISNTFSRSFTNSNDFNEASHSIQEMLIENFFHTARTLAIAVEARDPYTGGHSDRVFQISMEIGKLCNLNPTEQLYLEGGALLHDVGKIGIRDAVLLKPGPLTNLEYKEMQFHAIIGAEMVKKLNCLYGCIDVVLFHHERIDGYGYPYGIKGNEIPLIARITSIADAYDAMTTNRVYRKAINHEQALEEIIRNSGTQFDSDIVKIFVKWWEETFKKNPQKSKELYKNVITQLL